MEKNTIINSFLYVTIVEPEELKKYLLNEIGKRSEDKLFNFLKDDLVCSYPNFREWFYNIVIPQVMYKKEEREIIIVLSEIPNVSQGILTGIAILKKTKVEKKICTFRVNETYRHRGIGTELFEECFKYLGTDKPMITISQGRLEMFKNWIEKYNFKQNQVLDNYYKNGIKEYVFNGTI